MSEYGEGWSGMREKEEEESEEKGVRRAKK